MLGSVLCEAARAYAQGSGEETEGLQQRHLSKSLIGSLTDAYHRGEFVLDLSSGLRV